MPVLKRLKNTTKTLLIGGLLTGCAGDIGAPVDMEELITTGAYSEQEENETLREVLFGEWNEGAMVGGSQWIFKQNYLEWNGFRNEYVLFGDTLRVGALNYLVEIKNDSVIQLTTTNRQKSFNLQRE